jgi:UDPglucose 6-dehydrogenase
LADAGNSVLCIDVDAGKVERLKRGEMPIYEPGLEAIVKKAYGRGRIDFTTDAAAGVEHGLFQFVAVGTPPDEDGSADLQYVLTVARTIGEHLREYRIVVNKSTVPVGTADKVKAEIRSVLERRRTMVEFDVVSNPEFLKEGAAVEDFMKPNRIVVGTDNPRTAELLRGLYDAFTRNRDRMLVMDVRSAELTKYAANAMLATKISFMNELANLAEHFGADIEQVRVGIGSDPRIGYEFIYPGCGFGGSCFPKDVRALTASAAAARFEPELLRAVGTVNDRQKQVLFKKLKAYYGGDLRGKVVALWGLAFKPNTDDMREAASRALMEALWQAGASVRAYDPVAAGEARRIYGARPDLILCESANEALQGADALCIVTEWREFRSPDFDFLAKTLRDPVIFDGRNLYDPKVMKEHGLTYFAIGRGEPLADREAEAVRGPSAIGVARPQR